ncbi:enterobactin transporter EntS [Oceanobacter mangrovi]|uniref:enterobactin transporter EntS n=1 Tax=Oceanobacter mangrovi TaxID=2862510 RepID=UPI001C8DA371|nr:enterobactin transporter EntS [Oceanobacter mangrovi]
MKRSLMVDFGLLASNRDFRNVFIARTISLLGLGMLSVALPIQVFDLTADSFQVGLVMSLEGIGLFIGLLYGGVLADRYNRKRLILLARGICGLGFVGLAANAMWLPEPSLYAIWLLAIWDGFFGAIGVTALLAAMPHIVGRENLMQARAISMVSMRLATVISPALGGLVAASLSVAWNYWLAAIGTGLTLLPLLKLPDMRPPEPDEEEHPLAAIASGFRYLLENRIVGCVVLAGTLVTLTTAIRVLFPQLSETVYHTGPAEVGLMYSAIALGGTLGALVSGWANHLQRPGQTMLLLSLGVYGCVMALGLVSLFWLALLVLIVMGYLVSITALLQYTLVQGHTPDQYLGRINGIWTAQDASGDSIATLAVGAMGKSLSTLSSVLVIGASTLTLGVLMTLGFRQLANAGFQAEADEQPDQPDTAASDQPA